MFKEKKMIVENHKLICGASVALSVAYTLEVLKPNEIFMGVNIKWIVTGALVLGSWIIYELYLDKPKSNYLPKQSNPPIMQQNRPMPSMSGTPTMASHPLENNIAPQMNVSPQVIPDANKINNGKIHYAPINKEQHVVEEIKCRNDLADDSLPDDFAKELNLGSETKKEENKSAFDNFGLE